MEVGVAAAPVGDLGEGVSGQDVLGEQRVSEAARPGPSGLTLLSSSPDTTHAKDPRLSDEKRGKGKSPAVLWSCCGKQMPSPSRPWVGPAGGTRGRQVYGARNWKSESLKELKLWSQMRWSSGVGGGRQEDTGWGNTVCGLCREVPERETKGDMRKTRKVGTWSHGEDGGRCPLRQQPPPVSVVGLVSWPPR